MPAGIRFKKEGICISNRVDKGDLKEKKPDKVGSMLECFQHKQSIKG